MKFLILAVSTLPLAACSEGQMMFGDPAPRELVGFYTGQAEITTAEDPGSNFNLGDKDRGFSFPVALHLERNGRFELITSGFPATYDDEYSRICRGAYTRQGSTLSFYPLRACRALPLSRYTLGRLLPAGITLDASTGTTTVTYATIRVRMRLTRE